MLEEILIRILGVRRRRILLVLPSHHPDAEAHLQQRLAMFAGRLEARGIHVSGDDYILGLFLQELDILLREGCPHRCHGVADTDLMQAHHVWITLADHHRLARRDLARRLEPAKKHVPLLEEVVLLGIDVLHPLGHVFVVADVATGEAGDVAGLAPDRKYDPIPECVIQLASLIVDAGKASLQDQILLPSFA